MISAASLSSGRTLRLGVLTVLAASVLAVFHWPLPWYAGQAFELPFLYVVGIWLAIVLGAAFIGVYASRVAEEARKLSDALAATELVLAREQHLSQLDGLAAAAAHELGTPLATITLVVKELAQALPTTGMVGEDMALLQQEVARCRTMLKKLASLGDDSGGLLDEMKLSHLVEEVVSPQRDFGVKLRIEKAGEGEEPVCRRSPGMLYGLGNFVENAIDFAQAEVCIRMTWTAEELSVVIEDDGPGFSPDVLIRLGEPYLTTRGSGTDRRAKSEAGSSLGLGVFIAKTLLERSGANVLMVNVAPPRTSRTTNCTLRRMSGKRRPCADNSSADKIGTRLPSSVPNVVAQRPVSASVSHSPTNGNFDNLDSQRVRPASSRTET